MPAVGDMMHAGRASGFTNTAAYTQMLRIKELIGHRLRFRGSILPVAATSISDAVGSSSNLILNDDFIKDDNLIISDEIILRADDPSIAEESTKRVL